MSETKLDAAYRERAVLLDALTLIVLKARGLMHSPRKHTGAMFDIIEIAEAAIKEVKP